MAFRHTWMQLHLPPDPVAVKVGVPPALLRAPRRRRHLPGHAVRAAAVDPRRPHEGDPEEPLWREETKQS